MGMLVSRDQLFDAPDLAHNRDFIVALTDRPVRLCPNWFTCVEAETSGRVLAAVRKSGLDAWKKKMETFTRPRYIKTPTEPMSGICLLAAYVAQKAGFLVPAPTVAYYRRTRSGYVFIWMGGALVDGLDFFLAMNPTGSIHSYERYWL